MRSCIITIVDGRRQRHRGIAKLVRHGSLNPACVGSSPATPAIGNTAPLSGAFLLSAQLVYASKGDISLKGNVCLFCMVRVGVIFLLKGMSAHSIISRILRLEGEHLLLVLDIGNTNIVMGAYEGKKLMKHWRFSTDRQKTGDEYGMLINNLFRYQGIRMADIRAIIISSVVPPLIVPLVKMCERYFHLRPLVVGPGIRTGIRLHYENPRAIGADRIVNVVGAFEQYGGPLIVIDIGTATTFDVVGENGDFLGGVIAPGIGTSSDALFQRAAQLPRIELVPPKSIICHNTIQGMQAGIIFGYVGQIDEIVKRIKAEIGGDKPVKVIATGGLARMIMRESSTIEKIDHFLTLTGLRVLYERNAEDRRERRRDAE